VAGGNAKRGGGERVLESRHLVGLFLGVVLLCGVFFTLGYVMGRTQSGLPMPLHASADSKNFIAHGGAVKTENPDTGEKGASNEWDFYSKGKDPNKLEPNPNAPVSSAPVAPAPSGRITSTHRPADSPSAPAAQPVAANSNELRRFQAPRIPHGAVVVQLAALRKEADALALADAAQQKHFPSFVVIPAGDHLYHVQVGPYSDGPAAQKAKDALVQAGFNPIIKR
jgi:DedD protein